MTQPGTKQRIAVLGGGISALSAVMELTNQPGWQDRYEITVYQLGWRVGGKGASGRGPYGRIEEHGLHIWIGFYENAFRMIQQAYRELDRPPGAPLATWTDAFKPHSLVLVEESVDGRYVPWIMPAPTNQAVPGTGGEYPPLADYVPMLLQETYQLFHTHVHPPRPDPGLGGIVRGIVHFFEDVGLAIETDLLEAGLAILNAAIGHARDHAGDPNAGHGDRAADRLEEFARWLRALMERHIEKHDDLRRLFVMTDLGVHAALGVLRDGVIHTPEGLDALDDEDLRAWLLRHGASPISANSGAIRFLYDLGFAYFNGDPDRPGFAAGTALRCIFRVFCTYKGAMLWKMQAGMGDVVFTPLYRVLERRGVRFEFFHRVRKLELSEDRRSVAAVRMGRQATPRTGRYDPLIEVGGLECWPSEPNYDQLVEGDELRELGINLESFWTPWKARETEVVLRHGHDFDLVVFGIALGSVPFLCDELLKADPRWQAMVDNVQTNRTMGVQLWLRPDLAAMGWEAGPPVLDGYVEPMNTWADMSQLIPREEWPEGSEPRCLAYLCGTVTGGIPPEDDVDAPARIDAEARKVAVEWLRTAAGGLWPKATNPSDPRALDWENLVDPQNREGEARLDAQFWRVNIDPSERYVLTVPGSTKYRIKPGESGFENLVIVGDWTNNGFNSGCIEASVMSGLLGCQAICGSPTDAEIIGYRRP